MDQYDDLARLTFHLALEEANNIGTSLYPEHLFLALIRSSKVFQDNLKKSTDDLESLRRAALRIKEEYEHYDTGYSSHVSEEVRDIIKNGVLLAHKSGSKYATNEELAIALISSKSIRLTEFFRICGIDTSIMIQEFTNHINTQH